MGNPCNKQQAVHNVKAVRAEVYLKGRNSTRTPSSWYILHLVLSLMETCPPLISQRKTQSGIRFYTNKLMISKLFQLSYFSVYCRTLLENFSLVVE